MTQLISAVNNRNLFSNHYLESLIQKNREWSEDVNTFIEYSIKPTYLQKHPIRRISFTTPPARRAAIFEEAKALYSAEAPDSRKNLYFWARLEAMLEKQSPLVLQPKSL